MLSRHYLALAWVYPNRWISKDPNAVFRPLGDVCSMKKIRHLEEKTCNKSRRNWWFQLEVKLCHQIPALILQLILIFVIIRAAFFQLPFLHHRLPFRILQIRSDQISRSVVSDFCDPMNRSTPGLPVHHQLPEFTQTHVHRVSDAIQPSHPLPSSSPLAPNPSQHQSLFQ